ncbi:MAG: patatin-like phospholipase family protein, partial [Bacteroidota bacterium]|nr:patatin-like phospholipase family protein [Bacteroidota bacterium]
MPAGQYKRAIVLSGGGAKGDFQVGVLKYLYKIEGFFPDLVIGTSVGAVNAVKLAEATT